jgi:23S rRNA pseudouridine1911/1915/1917 synthase
MEEKIVYKKFERERIDSYLATVYKNYSRSYFRKLLDERKVFVNDSNIVLASRRLKQGDIVAFNFKKEERAEIKLEKIKLDIIYEDDDIIVINKHSGIVVHPSYGHESGTLLNALSGHSEGKYNPYLLHRLDKDTTGLIVFAKNERAKISISNQFQNRAVKKIYYAAVKGIIAEDRGIIEAPLGRSLQNRRLMSVNPFAKKMAVTEFKTVSRKDNYTLLEVRIITGRTHQIRSHMKYINHPVIGDRQYGGPEVVSENRFKRQMLHAYSITFTHPKTARSVEYTAELPDDMKKIFAKT